MASAFSTLQSKVEKLSSDHGMFLFERQRLEVEWSEHMIAPNLYHLSAKRLAERRFRVGEELWTETVNLRNEAIKEGSALPITLERDGSLYFARVNLYRDPKPRAKILSKGGQDQMRRDAIQMYDSGLNAASVPGMKKMKSASMIVNMPQLWCPVLRAWCGEDEMVAAQIVPARISIAQMDYLFGAGFGSRKYSFENCLLVNQEIEALMAAALVVFVPAEPDQDTETQAVWKIKVLRKRVAGDTKLTSAPGKVLAQLDGVEMLWKNANRPATRFMYYHYLMAHIRNWEYAQPGFADDWKEMIANNPFATLGPFWNRRHLEAIASYVGYIKDEDLERMAQNTTSSAEIETLSTNEANEYVRRTL
jgi:hypothetical protein